MKNNFFFYLICLLLISSNLLSKNKYTINGYFKDISNNESLIGANIFIKEINGGIVTNSYGLYSFTAQKGEYQYLGYKNIIKKILLMELII